jgi:hypothetical protein
VSSICVTCKADRELHAYRTQLHILNTECMHKLGISKVTHSAGWTIWEVSVQYTVHYSVLFCTFALMTAPNRLRAVTMALQA